MKQQAWAVMTDYVAQTLQDGGIDVTRIPEVSLNQDNNIELFSKYDKYWIRNTPSFYRLGIPPEPVLKDGRTSVASPQA